MESGTISKLFICCLLFLLTPTEGHRHNANRESVAKVLREKSQHGHGRVQSRTVANSAAIADRSAPCRGYMVLNNAMEGTITSPRYPDDYPPNQLCRWLIQAPVGSVIDISFDGNVNIEAGESEARGCTFDVLRIYDGLNSYGEELVELCGIDLAPPPVVSTNGSRAYILFKTDRSVSYSGFSLSYSVRELTTPPGSRNRCLGMQTYTEPSGTVTSPGFPNNYGIFSDCSFLITAPAGNVIDLEFIRIQLEDEMDCMYDSLIVYDGSTDSDNMIGVYCGNPTPPVLRSTGNAILIKFMSDLSINDAGFKFTWNFVKGTDTKPSPACGNDKPQILNREMGEFTSPGYTNDMMYENGLDCSWRIIVPDNMRAHLHFFDFGLEPAGLCRYDKLYVYDGYDKSASEMGPYCGDDNPGDITASGNVMYVTFKTDSSVTAKGFRVQFSGKEKMNPDGGMDVMCGVPSVDSKFGRIVGGQEAFPHSWPWQISMRYRGYDWRHWCGGSIIHNEWVVTAAHCVEDDPSSSSYRVVVGAHNIGDAPESTQETIYVREVIMHEDYEGVSGGFDNDIALFKLQTPITYNMDVSPVCLPSRDIPDRTLCVTTGWGETEGTGDRDVLQQVQVPTISSMECNQDSWYGGDVTPRMVCAGYPEGRKDSCQGDSGGPLVCSLGGPWTLHGITSWGIGCAEPKQPGVYARVARFVDWIETKTGVQFEIP